MAAYSLCSSAISETFGIANYNLRGMINGRSLLAELCNDPVNFVIAVQEHWLTSNNLHLLNSIHNDFVSYGVSAMSGRLEKINYRGRPYGSIGFLRRKSLSTKVRILRNDSECRCLAIAFEISPSKVLI
jgi:hypothetical protein